MNLPKMTVDDSGAGLGRPQEVFDDVVDALETPRCLCGSCNMTEQMCRHKKTGPSLPPHHQGATLKAYVWGIEPTPQKFEDRLYAECIEKGWLPNKCRKFFKSVGMKYDQKEMDRRKNEAR